MLENKALVYHNRRGKSARAQRGKYNRKMREVFAKQKESKYLKTSVTNKSVNRWFFVPYNCENYFEQAQCLLRQNTVKPPRVTKPC